MKNVFQFIDHELYLRQNATLLLNIDKFAYGRKMPFLQFNQLIFIFQITFQSQGTDLNQRIRYASESREDDRYLASQIGFDNLDYRLDSLGSGYRRATKFQNLHEKKCS